MNLLTRKTLNSWLDRTSAGKILIAPREVGGVLLYRPVSGHQDIVWDYVRPVLSAKEAFFPATERLLTIEKTGQTVRLQEVLPEAEQVLFGVRPCDARGIAILDALFIESEPLDANYARRREKSVVIGLACREMGETCFCTRVGGAPDDPTGMDLMLREVEGGYEVVVVTGKGQEICEELGVRSDPGVVESGISESGISESGISESGAKLLPPDLLSPDFFHAPFWAEMAERCLSCRICAYVCPTCRCFDVRDEAIPSDNGHRAFERVRCWDSCTGENYRRIAGGHNPRAEKAQRLRNRFLCKFYYYPQQYGPLGCTGCGRCVDSCPVNIDIVEVMEEVSGRQGNR